MSESADGRAQKPEQKTTPATPARPTITAIVQSCLDSFQNCLDQGALIHSREVSLVEDQLARFSIWAANIKALEFGRNSLDHRLREAPDIQDIVTGLLEALCAHLIKCTHILASISAKATPDNREKPLGPVDEGVDQILRGVSNNIGLLYKFSNTIRKASKATQDHKAARGFEIVDEDGNNVEPFLGDMFARYVLDKFPDADEHIRQRLVATMLVRRKRILYRRSRYGKTKAPPSMQAPVQPKVDRPESTHEQVPPIVQDETSQAPTTTPGMNHREETKSVANTATTLRADKFQKASSPSVISTSRSIALSRHEELSFPPAPCGALLRRYKKVKKRVDALRDTAEILVGAAGVNYVEGEEHEGLTSRNISLARMVRGRNKEKEQELHDFWNECVNAVGEITCPYCFHAIPAKEAVDERKWRLHVKNDLDPYICFFDNCDSAKELYAHTHTWLKHMREHSLKWKCTSKSHELFLTQSRGDYLQHMKHHHSGRFSQAQLDVLADRNGARMTGPMFPSCPLCGISKESLEGGSIESHLTGHLRLLALKSLPAYEESVGEDDDSDQNSVATSRPETRSTIRNYNNDGNDEVDGNRNWKAQDIRKLRSPNSDKNVKVFVEQHLQAADSSSFIDEGIFDGVPIHERRCFEWPLLAPSSFDSKPDPMLVSFIARWDRENRGSHGSWDGSMDPDCAICLRRASERCLCEAEALDMMIRQAEDRIFAPTRRELLRWVRKKSQDHVLRGFDSYWQDGHLHNQFEEHSSKQKQAPTTDTRLDSEQKLREQQERGKPPTEEPEPTSLPPAPTKGEVDDTWCTAYQSYPETLEYYFALAKVSLPESDDPAILDPPLAKWTLPPHDSYAELPTRPVSARREGQ